MIDAGWVGADCRDRGITRRLACAKQDSALRPGLLDLSSSEANVNTSPTAPISPERDYMREHLDDLRREVELLRAMVGRQRERIGDRHTDVPSLSPAQRPTSTQ